MSDVIKEKTTNFVQIKARLVMQIITSAVFRDSLRDAAKRHDKIEIIKILKRNGYTEDLADEVHTINFDDLEKSNILEVMPDDVEMMSTGGFNLNW
jgi:hypothetical protein